MTHYRVVTLDNGQRSETQAWGHDHSPNVETATAERVEVIKGPRERAVRVGRARRRDQRRRPPRADALDGSPFARGRLSTEYNHNTRGRDATVAAEARRGGVGARARPHRRASGDMRTPAARSATPQRGARHRGRGGHPGRAGALTVRYTGRGERIEIFDDPARSPGYSGYQRIATHRASAELNAPVRAARLQANVGYERNYRREFATPRGDARPRPARRQRTGFLHLHHAPRGPLTGTLGVSGMTSRSPTAAARR
jgi:iron complex outermembrane receptor protein